MYCRYCGANGADGKFCTSCGAPLAEPKPQAPAPNPTASPAYPQNPAPGVNPAYQQNPAPAAPPVYQQNPAPAAPPVYPQTPSPGTYQPYVPYTPGMAGAPKKKSHAPAIIAAVVIVLGLVAAAGLLLPKLFGKGRTAVDTSTPENYYQSVEKNAVATLSAQTANLAGFSSAESTLSFSFTDEGRELFGEGNFDWLKSLSLDLNTASDKAASFAAGTLHVNNTKIIAFELLSDPERGEALLKLPDFSRQYLSMPADSFPLSLPTADMDAVSKVVDRYGAIVAENLSNVEQTRETIYVGSTAAECDVLTVTVDSDSVAKIRRAIRDTAHNDRDLEALIRSAAAGAGKDPDEAYQNFLRDLDNEPEAADGTENTVKGVMKVYIDDRGEICGRHYVSSDTPDKADYYLTAHNGDAFETAASFGTGESTLTVTGAGTRNGDKITGDYTFRTGENLLASVHVENFDKKAYDEGKLYGSFTVSPGKDYLDESDASPLLAGFSFKIDVASESGKTDVTVSILSDGTNLGSLKIASRGKNVGVPQVSENDKADPETWMENVDPDEISDTVMNALYEAGVPMEMLG